MHTLPKLSTRGIKDVVDLEKLTAMDLVAGGAAFLQMYLPIDLVRGSGVRVQM
jgi:hypothetical protein